MSWFGKIKKSAAGAKDKLKAASADLFESTQLKVNGKLFRVQGRKYKAKKLLAEGSKNETEFNLKHCSSFDL